MADSEISSMLEKRRAGFLSATAATNFLLLFTLVLHHSQVGLCFFIDHRQSPRQHEWNYAQQIEWGREHRECAGNAQSPINIQHRNVIVNNHLRLHFYNYNQFIRFKIQNAHHTIKMNPIDGGAKDGHNKKIAPPSSNSLGDTSSDSSSNSSGIDMLTSDDDIETVDEFETAREPKYLGAGLGRNQAPGGHSIKGQGQQLLPGSQGQIGSGLTANEVPPYGGAPAIKLDWLDDGNNEYKLRDIHFHWGERRDNGSEHAIEGKRAAMEMHLVHIKHNLEKSKIGYTSDSVAVIAVLVESYRKSNADFNPIVNALGRINMTDQAQEIEYKAIRDLLPSATANFYTYSGSLTTPPCYQVVNWIVMQDRLYLNAKQIEMFRNLYAPHTQASETMTSSHHHSGGLNLIMPNVRHIQPLSNRTILASFSPYGRLEQIQIANSPMNGATAAKISLGIESLVVLFLTLCAGNAIISTSKKLNCS